MLSLVVVSVDRRHHRHHRHRRRHQNVREVIDVASVEFGLRFILLTFRCPEVGVGILVLTFRDRPRRWR